MPRRFKTYRPYIVVFCEGESEQAYTDFLSKKFRDEVVIKRPKTTGLFEEAKEQFRKNPKFRDNVEETDEIWFFFDVETKDIIHWDKRLAIINHLRKLRRKPGIRVRLLMTSGCIEYWLMLHYQLLIPSLQTKAEKDRMIAGLKKVEPAYEKGNIKITEKIAENYPTALKNGEQTMKKLLSEGMPGMEDTDERNAWLCRNCRTFSNVQEAILYLESLQI